MKTLMFEVCEWTNTWTIVKERMGYKDRLCIKNYYNKQDVDREVKYLLKMGYVDAGNYCPSLP